MLFCRLMARQSYALTMPICSVAHTIRGRRESGRGGEGGKGRGDTEHKKTNTHTYNIAICSVFTDDKY